MKHQQRQASGIQREKAQRFWLPLLGISAVLGWNFVLWRRDCQYLKKLLQSQPQKLPPGADRPKVSVLLPAWNEARYVEACIRSILALRYPEKELVICAGGADGTFAICSRFAGEGVIVLEQMPGEGKQGALRRCFEVSSGEILYLTDADSVLDDECLESTLAALLLEDEAAAAGCWQPFKSEQGHPCVSYQWASHLRYQAALPDGAETLDGRNSAIRREALLAAGGFQNEAAIGTDYVLSQRLKAAGYRIRSVLASRVQTGYPHEFKDYLQQGSRWYRNRLMQGYKFKQWRDVAVSLWSAGASIFMLSGSIALLLRWRALGAVWLAALAHLSLSQVRLAGFFGLSGFSDNRSYVNTLQFIAYAIVSDISMVKGLLDSFDWRKRGQW
jgi:cellulose synthase/poly-beta-1,6-N-acetylglucosamine synthase-like glycosyltransferase